MNTRRGSTQLPVRLSAGLREDTVFVPFHWGGLGSANLLTNPALDPTSRMPEFKVCAARLDLRVPDMRASHDSRVHRDADCGEAAVAVPVSLDSRS